MSDHASWIEPLDAKGTSGPLGKISIGTVHPSVADGIKEWADQSQVRIAALEAENERLRGLIAPFADAWRAVQQYEDLPEDDRKRLTTEYLTPADYVALAAALLSGTLMSSPSG